MHGEQESNFEESVSAARAGDAAAANGLFEPWIGLLRLQAARQLGADLSARVDPSDVVQESLVQAVGQIDQFRGQTIGEWVAWLQTMVVGHAAKLRRHHRADKRDAAREAPLAGDCNATDETLPHMAAIRYEDAGRLAMAVDRLPEAMRAAVVARVIDRQPWTEIAARLDMSPGAARVLWTRAIRRLRDELGRDHAQDTSS